MLIFEGGICGWPTFLAAVPTLILVWRLFRPRTPDLKLPSWSPLQPLKPCKTKSHPVYS